MNTDKTDTRGTEPKHQQLLAVWQYGDVQKISMTVYACCQIAVNDKHGSKTHALTAYFSGIQFEVPSVWSLNPLYSARHRTETNKFELP